MTPEEKELQKAMSTYTREVYATAIQTPFNDSKKFLKVTDSQDLTQKEKKLIQDYDMNKIYILMQGCDLIEKSS